MKNILPLFILIFSSVSFTKDVNLAKLNQTNSRLCNQNLDRLVKHSQGLMELKMKLARTNDEDSIRIYNDDKDILESTLADIKKRARTYCSKIYLSKS
jgi:hypothetical protein